MAAPLTKAVALRAFSIADLPFIMRLEADPEIQPYIRPWTNDQHIEAQDNADFIYLVSEYESDPIGFVILRTSLAKPGDVEFVRLAIVQRGHGFGKSTVQAVLDYAHARIGAALVWLEVFPENPIAPMLYEAVGFLRVDERYALNGFGGRPGRVIRMDYRLAP